MKTKTSWSIIATFLILGALAFIASCAASRTIEGGTFLSKGDRNIKEYLIDYRAEGSIPEGVTYHLVKTEKGLAIYMQAKNETGTLFENHWKDSNGDHFSALINDMADAKKIHAYEFVVPEDRMEMALWYVYPAGTYKMEEANGIKKPVPSNPADPATSLISTKSNLISGLELRQAAARGNLEYVKSLLNADAKIANSKNGRGTAPLHEAALKGHKQIVELLIAKGADVNIKNIDGITPIFLAAVNDNKDVIELLIAKGAEVNVIARMGVTPLHYAALWGRVGSAKLLIEKGANVNADSKAVTPLHLAAQGGKEDVVKLLIEKGADVNAKNLNSASALYLASSKGHMKIAGLLIDKGAEINAKAANGYTPLKIATQGGHKDVAELLRKRGGIE